jgi:hypothetical protein
MKMGKVSTYLDSGDFLKFFTCLRCRRPLNYVDGTLGTSALIAERSEDAWLLNTDHGTDRLNTKTGIKIVEAVMDTHHDDG